MRSLIVIAAIAAWAVPPIGPLQAASFTTAAAPVAAPGQSAFETKFTITPGFLPAAHGIGVAFERRLELSIPLSIQGSIEASFTHRAGNHVRGRIGLKFEF